MENSKPLCALTIGEYIELTKEIVRSVIVEENAKSVYPTKEDEEHFNIPQLAKFLNCSLVSIHSYKRQGLPFYRIGRKVHFKKSEVLAFMRSGSKGRKEAW